MRVHFTFICGSGVAQMAVLMKDLGYNVTGSDTDVYPPVSTYLEDHKIEVMKGISADNITKDIDLLVLGGAAFIKVQNGKNVEYERAKELGIKVIGWDELVGDLLSSKITIDVVGTYGKSTATALLTWILECAELKPNYMFGAIPLNFPTGVRKSNSDYAVFEGDEHPLLHFHEGGKFMYHKPTHALITAAKWDHINVYKTPEEYIKSYTDLVRVLKGNGIIVANFDGENVLEVVKNAEVPVIFYTNNPESVEKYRELKEQNPERYGGIYLAKEVKFDSDMTRFTVDYLDFPRNENWKLPDQMIFESPLIGMHNVQNALGTIAMALSLDVRLSAVQEAVRTFKNIKRRLEIIGKTKNGAIVIDDLAHSPVKAKETLKALKTRYGDNKIFAVFDAHSSLLKEKEVLNWLPGTFDEAYEVIIPKIAVQKDVPEEKRVYGKDLVVAIKKTQENVLYIPVDSDIVEHLNAEAKSGDVIIFMSSGGWRSIVTDLIA